MSIEADLRAELPSQFVRRLLGFENPHSFAHSPQFCTWQLRQQQLAYECVGNSSTGAACPQKN